MKNRRRWNAELIVAVMAVVIGVCTMFVYIYQARIMSKQMHASVWPLVQTTLRIHPNELALTINNKGVGPALVKDAAILVDGVRYSDSQNNMDSMAWVLTGKKNLLSGYTNLRERVIAANEEVRYLEITDTASITLFKKALEAHSFNIQICYCSVYGDCWTLLSGKTEACDECP
jgi:hypothetical protein